MFRVGQGIAILSAILHLFGIPGLSANSETEIIASNDGSFDRKSFTEVGDKNMLPVRQTCTNDKTEVIAIFPFHEVYASSFVEAKLRLHIQRGTSETTSLEVFAAPKDAQSAMEVLETCCNSTSKVAVLDLANQELSTSSSRTVDITAALASVIQDGESSLTIIVKASEGSCNAQAWIAGSQHDDPAARPALQVAGVVDSAPPECSITGAPGAAVAQDVSISFTGSDRGSGIAQYECQVDGGEFQSCTSPVHYAGQADGRHSFTVRAVDHAGNEGASARPVEWVLDTQLPEVRIVAKPPARSTSSSAAFKFEADDNHEVASRTCCLDGACVSCAAETVYTGLTEGPHTFVLHAADAAGNKAASQEATWTVDLAPSCKVAVDGEGSASRVATHPIPLTFRWSEGVQGFTSDKVVLGGVGGALHDWEAQGASTYRALLVPRGNGQVSVSVPAGAAYDGQQQPSAKNSNMLTLAFDAAAPVCTIKGPSTVQSRAFRVSFVWSEPVSGFDPAKVLVSGAATLAADWTASTVGAAFSASVRPLGAGEVRLVVPAGAAVDDAGNPSGAPSEALTVEVVNGDLFVADRMSGDLLLFSGDYEGGAETVPFAGSAAASALSVAPSGGLYIGQGKTVTFFAKGQLVATIEGFQEVSALAVDAAGALYIADAALHVVQTLNSMRELASTCGVPGEPGSSRGHLDTPMGVALDTLGRLYIADSGNRRVQVMGADGELLTTLSQLDSEVRALVQPVDVAIDGRGRIYVVDQGASSIEVFSWEFHYIRQLGDGLTMRAPRGIQVTWQGEILVLEAPTEDGALKAAAIHVFTSDHQRRHTLSSVGEATAMTTLRDLAAPIVDILVPPGTHDTPVEVTFSWNKPVVNFALEDIRVAGAGGALEAPLTSADHGRTFTAMLKPTGTGVTTLSVQVGAVLDVAGNANLAAPEAQGGHAIALRGREKGGDVGGLMLSSVARVEVPLAGGHCSVEAACDYELARYSDQLSQARLQEESRVALEREKVLLQMQEKVAERREALRVEAEERIEAARTAQEAERLLLATAQEGEKQKLILAQAKEQLVLDRELAQARAQAEAQARVQEAQDTEELRLREVAAAGVETRKAYVQAVTVVLETVGGWATALMTDVKKMQTLIGLLAAAAAAVYAARELSAVLAQFISKQLGRPQLIRVSSRSALDQLEAQFSADQLGGAV
ncbi:hypothetical protein CYMTET_52862 [Cymbomonas tetramitiformis]|uniref:Uncharacterized protein n=1 Tax=Cymbomonas tetramitiformis TaxID=36881 RepID=A0AAE0ER69_9CHLO|nr:hypothetical protein CYMTET_52862 [Cymbomonas tetramitiformis]